MFEITIKNLESNEVTEYKVDGLCLMTMEKNDHDDIDSNLDVRNTCVDDISSVIAANGTMRAAARLGIAKHEGAQDVGEEEGRKRMKGIMEALKKAVKEE